ncbi:MAG: DUF2147 domain-containing protein [Bacteroidales bacterium]|jgi:uncharacterized protein (DUF2147 family)|nr:DUF2147 domain-containing protein [Bacteroidales bacterium]
MVRYLLIIFGLVFLSVSSSNTDRYKCDDIVGYYYSIDPFSKEGSQSYIYKAKNGTYEGKVVWVENEKKKNFLGLVFLKNLIFNAKEQEWQDGVLIYPGKNGTFKTYMSFASPTQLKVRGYWGVSLLGKTMYWQKEKELRK